MNWLTIPQIKHRSKTAKGALKVSYEHWCQLYDATAKELRAEYKRTDEYLIEDDYCGLCTYKKAQHLHCRDCVFDDYCPSNNGIYEQASACIEDWYDKMSKGDWHKWKRTCKAVRDKLKELMNQT